MGHTWASHLGARLYTRKVPCTGGRQGGIDNQGALPETGNIDYFSFCLWSFCLVLALEPNLGH